MASADKMTDFASEEQTPPFHSRTTPATADEALIAETRHLLWVKIRHGDDGAIDVYNYDPAPVLRHAEPLTPRYVAEQFAQAIRDDERNWKTRSGSHERIIAQITKQKQKIETFVLHYYSIGIGDERLASYFVFDADNRPNFPGQFDFQKPIALDNIEVFFELPTNPRPAAWLESITSFRTRHRFTIVLSVSVGDTEYLGLDCSSQLLPYPYGCLIGGLPFGAEKTFLSICKPDGANVDAWRNAIVQYKNLFDAWNVICRKGSNLTRVFIAGEPGSGKELWFESIRNASKSHRGDNWQSLSATLPTSELKSLLYGERNGALERRGLLASCAGGGIFLDEIGKSKKGFRRDLLRVLEAKEFVPIGGLPTALDDVIFVFASTPADRKNAYDPPDFWTRMDVELTLPDPITLVKPALPGSLMSDYDKARLRSLLGHFWFDSLQEKQKQNGASVDVARLQPGFQEAFDLILAGLVGAVNDEWPNDCTSGIPVSPRRAKSLAATIASEYQWVGKDVGEPEGSGRLTAKDSYIQFVQHFVLEFFRQLVRDEQNKKKANERRPLRRKGGDEERGSADRSVNDA